MLLPPRSQTSLSFCSKKKLCFFFKIMLLVAFFPFSFQAIKQLRLAGTAFSGQSHIFLLGKTEPHKLGDNNHKILNDLLSCEYICMASYCWSFWIKQQGNVRCPSHKAGRQESRPLFPLWTNQFWAGEPCTRPSADDWIIQQLLERAVLHLSLPTILSLTWCLTASIPILSEYISLSTALPSKGWLIRCRSTYCCYETLYQGFWSSLKLSLLIRLHIVTAFHDHKFVHIKWKHY
jgi:hypothetical protein